MRREEVANFVVDDIAAVAVLPSERLTIAEIVDYIGAEKDTGYATFLTVRQARDLVRLVLVGMSARPGQPVGQARVFSALRGAGIPLPMVNSHAEAVLYLRALERELSKRASAPRVASLHAGGAWATVEEGPGGPESPDRPIGDSGPRWSAEGVPNGNAEDPSRGAKSVRDPGREVRLR